MNLFNVARAAAPGAGQRRRNRRPAARLKKVQCSIRRSRALLSDGRAVRRVAAVHGAGDGAR